MNKVEADVRAERDEIALETVKLDQQAAWRKLCDQWRDEPRKQDEPCGQDELDEPDEPCEQDEPCEVPEHKFRYNCWDEPDPLVVGATNLPRLSLPEAAVRLAILHDHVYNDGLFEPILSNEWYDSLGPLWQVSVICWRRRMDKLDEYEVRVLQRCLIMLQSALGTGGAVKQAPPLSEREQQVLDIITEQPDGHGIMGGEIIKQLRKRHGHVLGQGTLTGHIIPKLKKWYGVKNRPNVGYYGEQR